MIPTAHPSPNPNDISIDSAVFVQMTAECPYTLQWDAPFPLKIARSHGGSGPPSNTWFLRPTQVHNPNGTSIGSAVFAGSLVWQDRPTDHATRSVTIGRIYVCSTAMRPKNFAELAPHHSGKTAGIDTVWRNYVKCHPMYTQDQIRFIKQTIFLAMSRCNVSQRLLISARGSRINAAWSAVLFLINSSAAKPSSCSDACFDITSLLRACSQHHTSRRLLTVRNDYQACSNCRKMS